MQVIIVSRGLARTASKSLSQEATAMVVLPMGIVQASPAATATSKVTAPAWNARAWKSPEALAELANLMVLALTCSATLATSQRAPTVRPVEGSVALVNMKALPVWIPRIAFAHRAPPWHYQEDSAMNAQPLGYAPTSPAIQASTKVMTTSAWNALPSL